MEDWIGSVLQYRLINKERSQKQDRNQKNQWIVSINYGPFYFKEWTLDNICRLDVEESECNERGKL